MTKVDGTQQTDLGKRFNIEGYPTLKFFFAGENKVPVDYQGARELEPIVDFLNEKCETSRAYDGKLSEEAGIVTEFLPLVKEFIEAKKPSDSLLKPLESMQEDLLQKKNVAYYERTVPYYIRILKKSLEKGQSYLTKEFARVNKIANKEDTLTADKVWCARWVFRVWGLRGRMDHGPHRSSYHQKVDDMYLRRNVLRSILGASAVAEEPARDEL